MKRIVTGMLAIITTSVHAASSPPSGCETPASIGCIYGLTQSVQGCPISSTTTNPSGGWGTIAVVEAFNNSAKDQTDLDTFAAYFGLPSTTLTTYYATAAPSHTPNATGCPTSSLTPDPTAPDHCQDHITSGNNPCDEHVADIQWVHSMAPNAQIIVVEAKSDNIWDKMNAVCLAGHLVSQAGGGLVSMSWSTAEFADETVYDKYFQDTSNVVYVGASGDYSAPANYPSASPYVISAGGTSIVRDAQGNFTGETAWSSDSSIPSGSKNGGSGGPSVYESRPSYQNSVTKIVGNARGTPDISFDADPKSGVCVYSTYHTPDAGWFRDGGTSISAPALSGIINAANHRAASSFDELTYIYNNAIKNYHSYWHDILQGNNGYPALAGYDFTTGLGSPLGYGGK